MARNKHGSKTDRNNRQQSQKNRGMRRGERIEDTQETLRTNERSGNRKGISSPGRRPAAREDDERIP